MVRLLRLYTFGTCRIFSHIPLSRSPSWANSSLLSRHFKSGVENILWESRPSTIVCFQAPRFIVFASVGSSVSFPSSIYSLIGVIHVRGTCSTVATTTASILYLGFAKVSYMQEWFIPPALVFASLDSTSTLVFCSLGMCDISTKSKLPILFFTVARYFCKRSSFT